MPEEPGPDRTPPKRRRGKVVKIVVGVVVGVLVVAGVAGVVAYRHLNGNIGTIDLPDLGKRPARVVKRNVPHQPLNVLLIGSDTRKGQRGNLGGVDSTPGLSDTTIVLHLSADRKRAYAVSIPRDSMVQRPSCKKTGGGTDPGGLTQFNDAYAIGGPACTLKTIEQLTDVPLDHVVVIDFNGFRSMVNALGGVKVCLPEEVDDNIGHIHLAKGTYVVKGSQALDYVRVRHGIGDGGDLGRIKRQQAFLASLTKKAVSSGTLANPARLYKFLNAATSSISADKDLGNLKDMITLARQLRGIGLDNVKFLTIPTEAYVEDPNRLQWQQPQAGKLWNKLRLDTPLTKKQTKGSLTPQQKQQQSAAEKARLASYGLCS